MNEFLKKILSELDKNLIIGLIYFDEDNTEYCDWLKVYEIDLTKINENCIKIERIIINIKQ